MIDLKSKVESLGIEVFNGRYNGPKDLAEFAFLVHQGIVKRIYF